MEFLKRQHADGKTTEERIDEACRRILTARFRLGQFDPEELVPFAQIPLSVIGCEKHASLAYRAAVESIVLLKNNGILPLKPDAKVAVVGNNAHLCQFGDYSGKPKNKPVSPLDGICSLARDNVTFVSWTGIRAADQYTVITSAYLRDPEGQPGLRGSYYGNGGFSASAGCVPMKRSILHGGIRCPTPLLKRSSIRFAGKAFWLPRSAAPTSSG